MAGKTVVNKVQLGDSATATQNFVLQTNVDGTAKLARGNDGATTQDILTVDASGNVNAPVGIQKAGSVLQALSDFTGSNVSLAASGYQKLPGGLIIQWGRGSYSSGSTITFPISFPTTCAAVVVSAEWSSNQASGTGTTTASNFIIYLPATMTAKWIAIGY